MNYRIVSRICYRMSPCCITINAPRPPQTKDEMCVIPRNYCDLEYYSLGMKEIMTYTDLLLKSNLKPHYRPEICYIHKLLTLLKM
jgi:hypothetical protein